MAGGRGRTRLSLNGFNPFLSGFGCVFFSCDFKGFGEEVFLERLDSACLACSAVVPFALAFGAGVALVSDPLLGSNGAVGWACGTNVTGTLRCAIRFSVCSSRLFLSQ